MDLCCFTEGKRVHPVEQVLISWCVGASLLCTELFFVATVCVLFVVDM